MDFAVWFSRMNEFVLVEEDGLDAALLESGSELEAQACAVSEDEPASGQFAGGG